MQIYVDLTIGFIGGERHHTATFGAAWHRIERCGSITDGLALTDSGRIQEKRMLVPGDRFPDIVLPLVGGGESVLPRDVSGAWAYIPFYRGGW